MAFGRGVDAGGLREIIEWISSCAGGSRLDFRWRSKSAGWVNTTSQEAPPEALLAGDGNLFFVSPRAVHASPTADFNVSIFAEAQHDRIAPGLTWAWMVDGPPLSGPTMPPGVDREAWIDCVGRLALDFDARMGFVGGPDPGSAFIYGVHEAAFYSNRLDLMPGYYWTTFLTEVLFDRLMSERNLGDFPWFMVGDAVTSSGQRLHCLRATREPTEMTPGLWSLLRRFYAPLLPRAVNTQPKRTIRAWNCFAPEDIVDR